LGNRLFEHLRSRDLLEITLHQRANRLVHRFLAHLKRVADFDILNTGQRVLSRDRLVGFDAPHFVVIF